MFDVRKAALLAVVAAGAAGATTTAAAAKKPAAKKPAAKAPLVKAVTGPKTAVAPGAKVTVSAQARNAGRKAAKVTVTFHLSADKRWDRRDPKLGSAATKRLKPGRSGAVGLTAKLPAKVKAGSYTLFACTGPARKPACVAAKAKLTVKAAQRRVDPTPPTPTPPVPRSDPPVDPPRVPAALALQLDDRAEWGTFTTPDGELDGGDVVTTTVRLGAGLPGQAGYTVADVPAEPALAGAVRTVYAFDGNDADDESYPVELPFAVSLGGVQTRRIDVSTNGWLSTTGLARAYHQNFRADYRGATEALGSNVGVLAPFWTDMRINGAGQRIDYVEAADGSAVAIRWSVQTYDEEVPVDFEAVLFRDGRIRFDYLSTAPIGDVDPATPLGSHDDPIAIGLSPGVGGGTAQVDFHETLTELPAASRLYTPNAVSATPAAAGTVTVELPRGTTFRAADPACQLTREPTLTTAGLVTCATPAVDRSTASLDVSWQLPASPIRELVGIAYEQSSVWTAGSESASAANELQNGWFEAVRSPELDGAALLTGPTEVAADVWARGSGSGLGLRNPRLSAVLPAGVTLQSAAFDGSDPFEVTALAQICTGLPVPTSGGEVVCRLPNPTDVGDHVGMVFRADDTRSLPSALTFTLSADNLPEPLTKTLTIDL